MEVTLSLVADAANMSDQGKLNVLGEFDRISASSFPVRHPSMTIVIRLEATPLERGQTKTVEVKLVDDDGLKLARLQLQTLIGQDPQGLRHIHLLTMNGVQFAHPGNHAFIIMVGGEPKGRIPIELVQVLAKPTEGGNG